MKRNIGLLAICQALMMTCNSLLVSTAALVGFALAEDKSLATLPLALQFMATMLTTIPASLLMRQIGRRGGFILATLIGAGGAVLAAWAIVSSQFLLFCLGTMLVGVFNGFGMYYRFAAADAATDSYKNKAISYVMAGGVAAAFLGPNLANWTREAVAGVAFAGSYGALVGLYALSFLALLFVDIPRPGEHERHDQGRPLWRIARQPAFIVALISAMLGYGIMSLVMTATPLSMRDCGMPFGDTAFVIQWHVFAMFAPSFFTGYLINRFGVLNVIFWGALLNIGCITINLLGETVIHFWIALFLLGIGWNFLFVGGTSLLTETYAPEEKAKSQALNDFLVFTTVTLASLSAGWLQFHLGWRAVNEGVVPLIGVILLAVLWLRALRQRSADSASPAGA